MRSETLLDFRLAHARARDAVQAPFNPAALAATFADAGIATLELTTQARDRATYLRRPDLGRRLDAAAIAALQPLRETPADVALIISDGLSALAAQRQAAATAIALHRHLTRREWTLHPLLLVPFARVKLQDEIGEILGVRHTVMLLGERPGLGSPDSLGAYFTYHPRAACTDADRNCVSNIRPAGLPPEAAATKLDLLLAESCRLAISGVQLKDIQPNSLPAPSADSHPPSCNFLRKN